MEKLIICLFAACFTLVTASNDIGGNVLVRKCPGVTAKAKLEAVNVIPCPWVGNSDKKPACKLVKGSTPNITVTFRPNGSVTNVTAMVHGIIAGVPIPFHLPNPNGCKDSGLKCPLPPGTSQTYFASLPIKQEYPTLVVIIKWELRDQSNNTLVCFSLRGKISD